MGTACCMGAIKANVAALGADQFDMNDAKEVEQKSAYFSMFYQLIQLGSLIPGFFPGILGGDETSMGIAGLFFGAAGAMTIGLGVCEIYYKLLKIRNLKMQTLIAPRLTLFCGLIVLEKPFMQISGLCQSFTKTLWI